MILRSTTFTPLDNNTDHVMSVFRNNQDLVLCAFPVFDIRLVNMHIDNSKEIFCM